MEDFVVSARKYRPKTFESVVGQENITQTLLKAIENNHLAQAFLFCGPRGVGKTSCARILARTVNEFHSESGEIEHDFAFNIFELDAASNNSVEDIRNLIDQTRIPPQTGKYKVYIIDEVHMLSSNAFNAFLKTLEEPPPYAIFILATTEKHKVLPTIISRCQVFDFNSIQIPDIVAHLSKIATQEGIEADNDALHIIAEKADGALRDALSIFDQIVGFTGKKMTYQDVIDNLNILDYDYYFDITEAFLRGDKTEVLITLNTILNNGFDGHVFVNGLASHFRNLLFCTSERTASIMQVGATIQKRYFEQSQRCETRLILNAMHRLSDADINYKQSKNKRLLVELTLLGICALADQLTQKKNADSDVSASGFNENRNPNLNPPSGNVSLDISSAKLVEKPVAIVPSVTQNRSDDSKREATQTAAIEEETSPTKNSQSEPDGVSEANHVNESTPAPIAGQENGNSNSKTEAPNEPPTDSAKEIRAEEEPKSYKPEHTQKDKPKFSSKLSNAKSKGLPSLSSLAESAIRESGYTPPAADGKDEEDLNRKLHEDRPADDFNLAQLWKVWEEYAALIKAEDKKSYFSTLTKHQPVMRDKFKVELLMDNHVQLADLDADKLRLLEFLRERLNNWQIQVEGIIDDSETEDGDSLYDPRKKYEAMNTQNPILGKLKSIFDLDVEHDG